MGSGGGRWVEKEQVHKRVTLDFSHSGALNHYDQQKETQLKIQFLSHINILGAQ